MNWDYLQPVKIRFGKGRVSEVKDLAKEMGIKNGLLVATHSSLQTVWQSAL